MTITLNHKKAKKLLNDLAEMDIITINESKESALNKPELSWLDVSKHEHANKMIDALDEAKEAFVAQNTLKTLDEILNEL